LFRLLRLMILAPGHFHAALVLKRALHGVHPRTYVYGPLDTNTLAHLARVCAFNTRRDSPTSWEVDLRAGAGYLDRFTHETPGNAVVLSGRNRPKIDLMRLAVENCLHVLADKPWIVEYADFPKLEALFREAELRDVFVWDMLTERFEITNWLQREFVRDPELFGTWQDGTPEHPALLLHSVHYLKKTVNGQQLVRPWWWFDPEVSGEAMADVGTHLADLAIWLVAPDQAVDYATQIQMLAADRTPLLLSEDEFRDVTRLSGYPPELRPRVVNGQLYYAGNNTATFILRGVHVRLSTAWEYASAGGDTHQTYAHGTRATVSIRQQPNGRAELYVAAADPADHADLVKKLTDKCNVLQRDFAGLSVADLGAEAQVVIPEGWRASHEDHFGAVMEEFVRYFHTPRAIPHWEKPNALARYYITTKAVEMARGAVDNGQ
jgi:predicted dehydrogenase